MSTPKNDLHNIISFLRHYKRTIAFASTGWILFVAYFFYDYLEHKNFSHFFTPDETYELLFHMLIFTAPFISTFAGYLEYKKTQLVMELAESTEKWQTTFNSITDLILIIDNDFRIINANKPAIDRWGGIIGKYCYAYVHNTSAPIEDCPHKKCLATGTISTVEIEDPPLSGSFYEITCSPIIGKGGGITGSVHVAKDVTTKKKTERERKNLESQLYHAQKMESIGRFAGGIVHDFNNILTAIIGYSEIVRNKIVPDSALRKYMDQILSSADKATKLTSSILSFSRKKIINPEPININDIIKNTAHLLLRIIGEDVELKTFLCKEDLTVSADKDQIEQALMNLATNARDAMPDGGAIIIETSLVNLDETYAEKHINVKPGSYALIAVTDTGIGIDEGIKDRIFEPFFTTKDVGKGTGLGLAIVYGIIHQHEGYLHIYSEKWKGTTFKIYIPLTSMGRKNAEKISFVPAEITGGGETILVAEDSADVLAITEKLLHENGYNLITAVDGIDAVMKFNENKDSIQLFLTDVIMPRKNGKEAYEEIKKIKPGIKALFMSGYTANIIHHRGILEPDIEIITKPFKPDELLQKIRAILSKS